MFKNILLTLLVLFFSACSVSQKSLENSKTIAFNEELNNQINYILYLISKKDLDTLNKKYINLDFGFYEVNVNEDGKIVVENREVLEDIDNYVGSFDIKNKEVNFYCSPYNDALYGWSEDGVFVSNNIEHYLLDYLKINDKKTSDFIKKIMNNSVEVIVTYNIIFYLTKIDDKYFITLIDNVKSDCSSLNI